MSKTPTPPPAQQAAPPPASVPPANDAGRFQQERHADRGEGAIGIGAEIWIMSIIGLLLIAYAHGIISYEWSRLTHTPYHTGQKWLSGDHDGEEVAYPELMDFSGLIGGTYYTDACLVLLGLTLIVDAVGRGLASTRLPGRLIILGFTIAVTLVMLLYNLHVAAIYFHAGKLPLISLLAIAFGGYLAIFQFAMFNALLHPVRPRA